jgi:hypothetical protein
MMKPDINEAVPIITRLCNNLSAIISDKGQAGLTARSSIGAVLASAPSLCWYGTIGTALVDCFELVRQTGCTWGQMENVRVQLVLETPTTVGAISVRDYAIQMALAQIGKIIGAMTFTSRQDVDAMITAIQGPFADAEETAADTMDSSVYMGLITLHAAVVDHLTSTARPLPEMLTYQFAAALPSLVISYKLYGDASRYDQIRDENKVVHPLFCPPIGQALSQ